MHLDASSSPLEHSVVNRFLVRSAVHGAGGFLLFPMGRVQLGDSLPSVQLYPTRLPDKLWL